MYIKKITVEQLVELLAESINQLKSQNDCNELNNLLPYLNRMVEKFLNVKDVYLDWLTFSELKMNPLNKKYTKSKFFKIMDQERLRREKVQKLAMKGRLSCY